MCQGNSYRRSNNLHLMYGTGASRCTSRWRSALVSRKMILMKGVRVCLMVSEVFLTYYILVVVGFGLREKQVMC